MTWERKKARPSTKENLLGLARHHKCSVCDMSIWPGSFYWRLKENHRIKRHLKCKPLLPSEAKSL
jgi:hypothetical protein